MILHNYWQILLAIDSGSSSGPSSLETKENRNRIVEKQLAVEERRKQLWEAEQVRFWMFWINFTRLFGIKNLYIYPVLIDSVVVIFWQ